MKKYLLIFALFGFLARTSDAHNGEDHGGDDMNMPPTPCSACDHGNGMMSMRADLNAYWADVQGAPFEDDGVVRKYYIQADEVIWDFTPLGYNAVTGKAFEDYQRMYVKRDPPFLGSKYIKCIYREYTDASFTTLKERCEDEKYLGLLGPVIRAEVGDTIKIKFSNACRIPTSMHPHGVFYNKDSEGAPYADGTRGRDKRDDAVPPGGQWTYTWLVPERAGPASMDGSTAMWMYHSHADEVIDILAGLTGFMVITAKGLANPDATPIDVDKELFFNFQIFSETMSPYLPDNVEKFKTVDDPDLEDPDFIESNEIHSINGYLWANGPIVKIKKGSRVRWNIMSMDIHTPHWHGNTFVTDGMRMDIFGLSYAEMKVVDMVPDNVGVWLYHCHVPDHFLAGMITKYEVVE